MLRKSITIIVLFLTFFHVGAQQIEICPNQPLPPDWVVVDVKDCAGCCGETGIVGKPVIERIAEVKPGTEVEVCPQPLPDGWVITGTRSCAGCCGNKGGITEMLTIQRVDRLPVGSELEICPDQEVPLGWVVTDVRNCAGCCGKKGGLAKLPTIRKLEHFPPDRFMKRYYKAGK
jgi:hypothetical protein